MYSLYFHGRVFDPCCGSGGMFVQSERFVEARGGCTSVPDCLWVEPHLELSNGQLELQGEYPHPDSHPIDCPSCQSIGALDAGQWIGWMVAAYGEEGPNRVVEVHVDPASPTDGTTPANQWQQMCKKNWMTGLPSEYATRPLPVDFDEGLEMEIRLNNATSGDTQMMYGRVYELVPPTGGTTTTAYTRSYYTEKRQQSMVAYDRVAGAF